MSDKKKSSKKDHGVDQYACEDNNTYKTSVDINGPMFASRLTAMSGTAAKIARHRELADLEPLTEAELELLDPRFAKEKAAQKLGVIQEWQDYRNKVFEPAIAAKAHRDQKYVRNYVNNPPIGAKSSWRSASSMLNNSADVTPATVIDTDKAPTGNVFTRDQFGDILMDLLEQADIANDMLQVAMKQTQRLQTLIAEMVEYTDSATENGDE
jgi:hypothetical protein